MTASTAPNFTPPPSPSVSKAVMLCFVSAIAARDFEALAALFTPTATWTVAVNSTRANWAGTFPTSEHCQRVEEMLRPLQSWSFILQDIVADVGGELVVAECMSKGRGPGSLRYDNNYMFKARVDSEGMIVEVKEMLDPYEVEIMLESSEGIVEESARARN